MLRPSTLVELIQKARQTHPDIQNIFFTNEDGQLLAAYNSDSKDKAFIQACIHVQREYTFIAKHQFKQDDLQLPLQVFDFENGKLILQMVCDQFMLGVLSKDRQHFGMLLKQSQALKNYLESQFQKMQIDEEDYENSFESDEEQKYNE